MILAAFDWATVSGVAVGPVDAGPTASSINLGEAGRLHGPRFTQAFDLVVLTVKQHGVTNIVVEKLIVAGGGKQERIMLAAGFRAATLMAAHRLGLPPPVEIPVQTARKHFIGRGNLPRATAKIAVMDRCRALGWDVEDDNAADACAVWDCYRAQKGFTSPAGPLLI